MVANIANAISILTRSRSSGSLQITCLEHSRRQTPQSQSHMYSRWITKHSRHSSRTDQSVWTLVRPLSVIVITPAGSVDGTLEGGRRLAVAVVLSGIVQLEGRRPVAELAAMAATVATGVCRRWARYVSRGGGGCPPPHHTHTHTHTGYRPDGCSGSGRALPAVLRARSYGSYVSGMGLL